MENLHVIGFSAGIDADGSFKEFVENYLSLLETGFNEIICSQLSPNYT
jgi:hypothetical protein